MAWSIRLANIEKKRGERGERGRAEREGKEGTIRRQLFCQED